MAAGLIVGESLADASQQLVRAESPERLRTIVETLVQDTRTMREANQALESRLNASKQEISLLQENLEAVRTESLTDPLTSLANRKYFDMKRRAAAADEDAVKWVTHFGNLAHHLGLALP